MKILKCLCLLCLGIIMFVSRFEIASTLPPDYCLHQLNKSDCNARPTLVFSYYKPGSRCELETWRGCPTYNKFDDQYQCSNTCIYKYSVDSNENKIFHYEKSNTKLHFLDDINGNWEDEIYSLPKKEKQDLNDLLNTVINAIEATSYKTVVSATEGHTRNAETILNTESPFTSTREVTQNNITEDVVTTTILTTVTTDKQTSQQQITKQSPFKITSTKPTKEFIFTSKEIYVETTPETMLTTDPDEDIRRPVTKSTTKIIPTVIIDSTPAVNVVSTAPLTTVTTAATTKATTEATTEATTIATTKATTTATTKTTTEATTKATTIATTKATTTATTKTTTKVSTTKVTATTGNPEEVILE